MHPFGDNISYIHSLVHLSISQNTKFEMPSFIHFKDIIGTQNFKIWVK